MRSSRGHAASANIQTADGAQPALVQAFLERSVKMLERVTASATPKALKSALSSATDVGGVASLLSDLAPLGIDLSGMDPFAEAMARGVAIKRELLSRAGGALSSTQVATALGITRQAVDKRRTRGTLLAVANGSGDYVYPACQFTPDGVVPGLEEVLRAFQVESSWTRLSVLLSPSPALRGRTVLHALKSGAIDKAVAVVESFGEQ
jgi:hypothetical protein